MTGCGSQGWRYRRLTQRITNSSGRVRCGQKQCESTSKRRNGLDSNWYVPPLSLWSPTVPHHWATSHKRRIPVWLGSGQGRTLSKKKKRKGYSIDLRGGVYCIMDGRESFGSAHPRPLAPLCLHLPHKSSLSLSGLWQLYGVRAQREKERVHMQAAPLIRLRVPSSSLYSYLCSLCQCYAASHISCLGEERNGPGATLLRSHRCHWCRH